MSDAVMAGCAQFAFTIMFHSLFPILTMGLGTLIAVLKTLQIIRKDERYGVAARFWAKIFALNFAMGVVTGIPIEFQFGTNWAHPWRSSACRTGRPESCWTQCMSPTHSLTSPTAMPALRCGA